jgi:hypothetical protein
MPHNQKQRRLKDKLLTPLAYYHTPVTKTLRKVLETLQPHCNENMNCFVISGEESSQDQVNP